MIKEHKLIKIEDYKLYIGAESVDRIYKKAEKLRGFTWLI